MQNYVEEDGNVKQPARLYPKKERMNIIPPFIPLFIIFLILFIVAIILAISCTSPYNMTWA